MALNKDALKVSIKTLLTNLSQLEDKEAGLEAMSSGLADIIDSYVKSATVTVQPGIVVTTTGGNGSTASTGVGVIS